MLYGTNSNTTADVHAISNAGTTGSAATATTAAATTAAAVTCSARSTTGYTAATTGRAAGYYLTTTNYCAATAAGPANIYTGSTYANLHCNPDIYAIPNNATTGYLYTGSTTTSIRKPNSIHHCRRASNPADTRNVAVKYNV